MKSNHKLEQIDPDEIEREASSSGRHWKEVLREQLRLLETSEEEIAKSQKQAQQELHTELMSLPITFVDDGLSNRDHLYGKP